ncbi:MAG: T9SS type A sorting domain-containing protein [Flavobacteriia bacterium]|nr:T9SS type A sorting domain-containing protein [Flavobacteriia bacterium]
MRKVIYIFFLCLSCTLLAQQPKSQEIEGLKIYPNPVTQGKVYIESTDPAPKKIVLYDVFGSSVLEADLKTKELGLPRIKPGIYVIRIYTQEKSSTRKLVIK